MARGDIAEICVPPRGTAVLARAKTGMMKKVESGESLQPYVLEAATVRAGGCNRMRWRLQPYALETATVCDGVRARRGAGSGVGEITR